MRFLLVAFLLFTCVAFVGKFQQKPKTYTLTLPYQEWVKYANGLDYAAQRMRQSDLPSRDVALIVDSVFMPLFTQINAQVSAQLEAEKKAVDTASKKQPTQKNN